MIPDYLLREEKNFKDLVWHEYEKRDFGYPCAPPQTQRKRGDFGVH